MARRTLILTASLAAVIASVGFVATDRALAAEPHIAGMQVTSSDATARFIALGVSKSVVIDFPTDLKEVLVADPSIVKAVALTQRRIHVIAAALGQTNVYFYAADGRQIGALNVAVLSTPPEVGNYVSTEVTVYRGGGPVAVAATGDPRGFGNLNCGPWPFRCVDPRKPGSDQPPGTQNINVTGNMSAVSVSPK
jgi:hypothetical protein